MKSRTSMLVALALVTVACTAGADPSPRFQEDGIHDQIRKLGSDDFEEQGKAAKALELRGREVLPHLKRVIDSTSADTHLRDWCKRIMAKIESADKRFKDLVEKLGSADDEVKEAAEEELRKIGRPAIPYLRPALKSENKNLRRRSALILRELGSEEEWKQWLEDSKLPDGVERIVPKVLPYGGRFGGRENLVAQAGGTRATESSVLSALKWLARHQDPDGSWGAKSFRNQCVDDKCAGAGDPDYDTGVTGLALLAFLGAGYSHLSKDEYPDPVTPGKILKFGEVVKNGLKWLMSKQDAEGCVGERGTKYMYGHSIATLALSEAYGMSATVLFKDPAQKAVDFIVAAQNPDKGWRYSKKSGDNDTSVTGWAIQALKSAQMSELKLPGRDAYVSAGKWLDQVTDATLYYRAGYNGKSSGKVFVPSKNESFFHHETMTAINVLCRIFMNENKKEPALGGVQLLVKDLPEWKADAIDYYYWYFATSALFQYDGPNGPYFKKWTEPVKNALVPNQKTNPDGCARGSWNSEEDRWGFEGGRVYAVALNTLTLETYYRYPRVLDKKK